MVDSPAGENTVTTPKVGMSKKTKNIIAASAVAVVLLVALFIWSPWNSGGSNANAALSETADTTAVDTTMVDTTTAAKPVADTTAVQPTPQPGGSGGQSGGSSNSGGNAGSSAGNAATSSTALTVDTVNVRNTPAKTGTIVQQLIPGDTITPVGVSPDGKWLDTGSGWVYRSLVKGDTVTTKSTKTYTRNAMLKPSKNAKDKGGVITVHSSGGWK